MQDSPLSSRCECPKGLTGDACNISTNDCRSAPSEHGGTCVIEEDNHRCSCPYPYTGARCEMNSDPCYNAPCLHGGTCVLDSTADGGYICSCTAGFIGRHCQVGVSTEGGMHTYFTASVLQLTDLLSFVYPPVCETVATTSEKALTLA